jgi:hypothetical protein
MMATTGKHRELHERAALVFLMDSKPQKGGYKGPETKGSLTKKEISEIINASNATVNRFIQERALSMGLSALEYRTGFLR